MPFIVRVDAQVICRICSSLGKLPAFKRSVPQVFLQQQQPWQRESLLIGEQLAGIEQLSTDLLATCIGTCGVTAKRLADSTIGMQLVEQILAPMNPSKQQDVQHLYAVCLQVASNQDFGALQKALRSCPLMHGALDRLLLEQTVARLGLACQEVHRYAAT